MSIELSIEVWPWVSLLLWLMLWGFVTCLGCGLVIGCYYVAKAEDEDGNKDWVGVTLLACWACIVWFIQFYFGVHVNWWLAIVFE